MEFEEIRHIYTAYDGRIILRTAVDRPSIGVGNRFEYLSSLSRTCDHFAAHKLLYKLSEQYKANYGLRFKSIPYSYSIKMNTTYSDNIYLSVLIIASVKKDDQVLFCKYKSVIFQDDKIVPQNIITKRTKDDLCLIICEDGVPCMLKERNGRMVAERAEKYRFPI